MNMRQQVASKFFLPALISGLSAVSQAQSQTVTPNVLFIMVDDLGWADLSCYGRKEWQTPQIDRLAEQGLRFSQAYAQPLCSPTRCELMSGKHAARLRVTDWLPGFPNPANSRLRQVLPAGGLDASEVTLAEAFEEAGYRTALIGKWHAGLDADKQGFQELFEYSNRNAFPRFEKGRFMTVRKSDAAVDFMRRNKANPFFLYLSFHAVHTPIDAEPSKIEAHAARGVKNAEYAAMVEHVDDAVGVVLGELDALGLAENTLVVFYSDNGGVTYCNQNRAYITLNFPLRGNKGSLYEGGVRVPLIVRYPGKIEPGSKTDAMVMPADFYPTLLELTGIPPKPEQHVDGRSFAAVLRGEEGSRNSAFWHYPHYSRHAMGYPSSAIRDGDWKLIHWYETGEFELYNLSEDLGEQNNLLPFFKDKADSLKNQLNKALTSVNAEIPKINSRDPGTKAEKTTQN